MYVEYTDHAGLTEIDRDWPRLPGDNRGGEGLVDFGSSILLILISSGFVQKTYTTAQWNLFISRCAPVSHEAP